MTFRRLFLENLLFHWRGNLAVLLGVAVGTAVLTGALLVGDSLRGSLHDLTAQRLGWIDQAMLPGRFFRDELAADLVAKKAFDAVAPVIMLQGTATTGTVGNERRASRVTVLGVDDRFWLDGQDPMGYRLSSRGNAPRQNAFAAESDPRPGGDSALWQSDRKAVILNQELAQELHVRPGDTITLNFARTSAIPRETVLGRRDAGEVLTEITVEVRDVLPADRWGGRFSMSANPSTPRNAFVPLRLLQEELTQKGRANGLLARGAGKDAASLGQLLTLDDWGLMLWDPTNRTKALFAALDRNRDGFLERGEWRGRLDSAMTRMAENELVRREAVAKADLPALAPIGRPTARVGVPPSFFQGYYQQRGYLSLESRQLILGKSVAEAAMKAASESGLRAAPTLVYLANTISTGSLELSAMLAALDPSPLAPLRLELADRFRIPYSVVAALHPSEAPPLGPFLPEGGKPLDDSGIILANWDDSPLRPNPGDRVLLSYFGAVEHGRLPETTTGFEFRGFVSMTGVAADPDLTPEFPGITDKRTLADWNPPFPYHGTRVQQRDEDYWNHFRTTPKAYVTLETGKKLWGSRFGELTSIRLAPEKSAPLEPLAEKYRQRLLANLSPESGGFRFDNIRQSGQQASSGGVDFSMLFLGFSFFLIAAALLLVGLLVRLNIDRRASEVGLLLALGYSVKTLRRLFLGEGLILSVLGGLIGSLAAILYGWGLMSFLNANWPGELDRSFLRLHVSATSFLIGYAASVAVSMFTIAWAVRVLGRAAPTSLLAGQAVAADRPAINTPSRWGRRLAWGGTIGGILLIIAGGFIPDHESQAGSFFTGGGLLLTAGLALVWLYLRREESPESAKHLGVASLGLRNAGRYPTRSLLTAGLLAASAFLIVAVESFRREPGHDFLNKTGGSGGFPLLAESDIPIFQDLNEGAGRQEMIDALDRAYRQAKEQAPAPEERLRTAEKVLNAVHIMPFRVRAGDDTSCLNLYQPGRPRLLGVPRPLIDRGGFQFSATLAKTPEENANPWLLLLKPDADGAIPVFGETNSVGWMLKKSLADVYEVPNERNERGKPLKLRIVGLFQDSVFQGELLMAEPNFLRLYPAQEGYSFFLIETPASQTQEAAQLLQTGLASHGFDVTPASRKLADYLAVENTYLSTFQALGGLGLLLGSLGLAVVLLRSVWERRGELALLRAMGFRRRLLGWMVLAENAFLLALGLAVGTVAALISVAPHVLMGQGRVPWLRLGVLLAIVLLAGLAAGSLAMRATLRAPLLPALRRE